MNLHGKDILHGEQFRREHLDAILEKAREVQIRLEKGEILEALRGKILGTLFFEPSTRTRLSFEAAMHRLGGSVIGFASTEGTSIAKGESFEDTIRTVDQYVDAIAVRHPAIGSAERAAKIAGAPVFNCGDGAGQHPTQALLDLFTIHDERGTVDGATILLCGDLKHGRTVHAGVELYKHYRVELVFVSPDELRMPEDIVSRLEQNKIPIRQTSDLDAAITEADVIYMTRIQKERFTDLKSYESHRGRYILSRDMLETRNPKATVLHPLPRVDEITPEVDTLDNAAYFRQVRNGMVVRMALLMMVLGA
jgi:aspartate carbamoyltransferase catalytic subunit